MWRRGVAGGAISSRMASNTTLNCASYFFSSAASLRAIVHRDADHGYALPDRDVFDKQAANRDWERIFAMFRRQLDEARG